MEGHPSDHKKFDAEWYFDNFFATEEAQDHMVPDIEKLHYLIEESKINGGQLLDIGTGPVVHTVLSASARVKEIYLSDYAQSSLNCLDQWLRGERQTPRKLMQCVLETEGTKLTIEERENEVRSKVKGILHIDVNSPQPLGKWDKIKEFDVIMSSGCIEAATTTIEDCQQAVVNMTSLLKKGGTMILLGGLGGSHYKVGDIVYKTLTISKPELEEVLQKAGLHIEYYDDVSMEGENQDLFSCPTWYYIIAKKL